MEISSRHCAFQSCVFCRAEQSFVCVILQCKATDYMTPRLNFLLRFYVQSTMMINFDILLFLVIAFELSTEAKKALHVG